MNSVDSTRKPPASILGNDSKTWAWIKYQFDLRSDTLADIARAHGVRRQTLYSVGYKRYPRMEFIVASALGLRPQKLWPHRYTQDGLPTGTAKLRSPRKKVRNQHSSTSKSAHDSKATVSKTAHQSNVNQAVVA